MFFIDESGSIPKQKDARFKNKYFVVGFAHTSDSRRIKNVYKRAIGKLRSEYPSFFASLPNPKECKGSEMLPFMKFYIITKLIEQTDIQFAHMVVDTSEIDESFRSVPGRSFNFLVKIITEQFGLTIADQDHLQLKIDNRNVSLKGLTELEGYLHNTFVLENRTVKKVSVEYLESCDNYNIQVADLVANIVYQRFRYKTLSFPNYADLKQQDGLRLAYTYEYIYNALAPRLQLKFVYPVKKHILDYAAASIAL